MLVEVVIQCVILLACPLHQNVELERNFTRIESLVLAVILLDVSVRIPHIVLPTSLLVIHATGREYVITNHSAVAEMDVQATASI
jgi:hypothetical protein